MPYLIKLVKLYSTSLLLSIFINIIPASEPIGVRIAQIFDAATTPYMQFKLAEKVAKVDVISIVIGMLFNRFPNTSDSRPIIMIFWLDKKLPNCDVKPETSMDLTITDIESKNGIKEYGKLINELNIIVGFSFLIIKQINTIKYVKKPQIRGIYQSSKPI